MAISLGIYPIFRQTHIQTSKHDDFITNQLGISLKHEAFVVDFNHQKIGILPVGNGYAMEQMEVRTFGTTYSYGHLPVITGYKWNYTFYKWGYKYL